MPKPAPKTTFTLGAWRPDRTAPVLDAAGQPVGYVIQLFGWYDIDVPQPDGSLLRMPGGKKLEKALWRFGYYYADLRSANPTAH